MAYRGMLALEGARFSRPVIALEDEEVAQAEAQELAAEIPADLNDAERSIDVAESLDSVADIADNIESPQATDVALIQTAADLAVAGSDVPPEEVIPVAGEALESAIGHRIATESIRETALAIYERLKAFVKRIWEKIESFWHKYFGTLPRLKRKIEAMQGKINSVTGRKLDSDGKSFELTSGLKALSVDYKVVKNGAELKTALEFLTKAVVQGTEFNTRHAAKLGRDIADLLNDMDDKNVREKAEAIYKLAPKSGKPELCKNDVSSSYGSGLSAHESDSMLGSVKLLYKTDKLTLSDRKSMLGRLEQLRRTGLSLVPAGAHDKEVNEVTFTTLNIGDAETILGLIGTLVQKMEDYERGAAFKEIKKSREALDKAAQRAASRLGKIKAGAEDGPTDEDIAIFRSCANLNVSYTSWTSGTAVALSSRVVTTANAVLAIVARSMAQYK